MMTDERSEASWVKWARAVIFFCVVMTYAYRQDVLGWFGLTYSGWPRWIFAGVLAFTFMASVMWLSSEKIPRAVAEQPRAIRVSWWTLMFGGGAVFLLAVYAHLSVYNAFFWIAGLLFLAGCVLEISLRVAAGKRRKLPHAREA